MNVEGEDWLDDEEDQEDDESSEQRSWFLLDRRDKELLQAAKDLAWKMVRSPKAKSWHLVGLGRAIYALDRLPAITEGVEVDFSVRTPYEQGPTMQLLRHWTVQIGAREISLNSGGYVDVGLGGGSFQLLSWFATPDREPLRNEMGEAFDLDRLGRFPDRIPPLASWPDEIELLDLSTDWFELHVQDNSRDMSVEPDGTMDEDEEW